MCNSCNFYLYSVIGAELANKKVYPFKESSKVYWYV